jgi:hypothetical protein
VRTADGHLVKGPKSDAGRRDVTTPPHLLPAVRDHLTEYAAIGRDGLLFLSRHGGHMAPSSLYRVFYPAREAAGRPDLQRDADLEEAEGGHRIDQAAPAGAGNAARAPRTITPDPGRDGWAELLTLVGSVRRLAFDRTLPPSEARGRIRDAFQDYDQQGGMQ